MTAMTCQEAKSRLGELLDGELADQPRDAIERHLESCSACRAEYASLRATVAPVAVAPQCPVPPGLWQAIEARLDRKGDDAVAARFRATGGLALYRLGLRGLAAAAAIVLAVGLGWILVATPWTPVAEAAQIDFRPLLERADGDIKAGIDALLRAYGGETISLAEASARMKVRVHVPEELPGGLQFTSMHLLKMGRHHESLAFHFEGPGGQLLLLQCPANVQRQYGNFECLSCQVGAHDGHIVRAGPLRLMHMASRNVCVCIVATLDEQGALPAALDAIEIEF